jgi:DNA-binding response OmpR family regulator
MYSIPKEANKVEEDSRMSSWLKGARVLVIENDPFIAAELDLMVEDAGGEVVALAGSYHDAVTLLGREPVDGAILGCDLPHDEGPSVEEELKRLGIPFVSAFTVSSAC